MAARDIPWRYVRNRDPALVNLIREKQWKEAWDLVSLDPTAPYNFKLENGGMVRLPLHELCRMIRFLDHVEDEEFSDDENQDMITQEERVTNEEIYRLARFMIIQSQSIETPFGHLREADNESGFKISQHRSILDLKDHHGNTPLHILCEQSCDTTMMRLLLECCPNEEDRRWLQPSADNLVRITNDCGCIALHFLAEGSCPFSALQLMLEYCSLSQPDLRLSMDKDNDIPLHWAFACDVSPRRLKGLLSECHSSLLVQNYDGRLPMQEFVHEHCENFDFMDNVEKLKLWNKIQGILKVVNQFDQVSDSTWFPMHEMARQANIIPREFWSIGLNFEMNSLTTYNKVGMLPLHELVSTPPQGHSLNFEQMISEILLHAPAAPSMPTSCCCGRLALHLAVESQQQMQSITPLLRAFPPALSTIDPFTRLPPFMLAAVKDNSSLDVVYGLLREDPTAFTRQ